MPRRRKPSAARARRSASRADRPGIGTKLLTQADGHCVLQVRPAGFHDAIELSRLHFAGHSAGAAAELSNSSRRQSAPSRIAVGMASLVDCAMLTWSFGCT